MLSAVYGRVTQYRRGWYDRHPARRRRLEHPLISVGNLVVGGSGKTPVVAALARLLAEAGERPAILSRGYGRRHPTDDVLVVSDGRQVLMTTEESGDEPQMLARALPGVPVLVCRNRHAAGQRAEQRFGVTVSLLDDGFQHLQLVRDVDLLLVSPADLADRPLPAGRLREPLAASRAADAVLVPGSAEDAARVGAALGIGTVFHVDHRYGEPLLVQPFGSAVTADAPIARSRPSLAVAAIARPERFFAAAALEGWNIRRTTTFRDHYWFSARDVARLVKECGDVAAEIVLTTEKDAVRLERLIPAGDGPVWMYLPMQASIQPADAFRDWLLPRLRAARSSAT